MTAVFNGKRFRWFTHRYKSSIVLTIVMFHVLSCTRSLPSGKRPSQLKVGLPDQWMDLDPTFHSSKAANIIVGNQFEALVKIDSKGIISPLTAQSWSIDPTFKVYRFSIERGRKFSDGSELKSHHFKETWERVLARSDSIHPSPLDGLLSKVVGWENFKDRKSLEGLRTPDDYTVEIRFKESVPDALFTLSLNRFSAYRVVNGKVLGTGPYQIVESSGRYARMVKNKYYGIKEGFDEITVSYVPPDGALAAMRRGDIDVYPEAEKVPALDCSRSNAEIGCIVGNENTHDILELNLQPGRLFSSLRMREALLSAISSSKVQESLQGALFKADFQIFLPFQLGRISRWDEGALTRKGQKALRDLVETSQKIPVRYVSTLQNDTLLPALKSIGVSFTSDSGVLPVSDIINIRNTPKSRVDIVRLGLGLVPGDPGDISYFLSKNGRLTSKASFDSLVDAALANAEQATDRERRRVLFTKVTKVLLSDIPIIHLGDRLKVLIYKNGRMRFDEHSREVLYNGGFSSFAPVN